MMNSHQHEVGHGFGAASRRYLHRSHLLRNHHYPFETSTGSRGSKSSAPSWPFSIFLLSMIVVFHTWMIPLFASSMRFPYFDKSSHRASLTSIVAPLLLLSSRCNIDWEAEMEECGILVLKMRMCMRGIRQNSGGKVILQARSQHCSRAKV